MTVYFVAVSKGPFRSITHYAGSLLANADVVIGDATDLDSVRQCIGPNAEQIAFVAPQEEIAYERELHGVVARHRSDVDAIVVRLINDDQFDHNDLGFTSLEREIGFLSREQVDFEVVSSVPGSEPADPRHSISLPRTGPLVNVSVVVTRARHQSAPITNLLLDEGAIPIVIPVIDIEVSDELRTALDQAIGRHGHDSWVVLSSRNAVASLLGSDGGRALLGRSRIACIGAATKMACVDAGLQVDFLPTIADAETLVSEFPPPESIASGRVTFFASDISRRVIEEGLAARGYIVDRVDVYATVRAKVSPFVRRRAHGADAIIFTSPSTVTGSIALFGIRHIPSRIVSIGPATSATVRDSGLLLSAEAPSRGLKPLVGALIESFTQLQLQPHD